MPDRALLWIARRDSDNQIIDPRPRFAKALGGRKRWLLGTTVLCGLIVIACLKEVNAFFSHEINDAVFLGQAARPCAWRKVL
jgi:hypothetical protein